MKIIKNNKKKYRRLLAAWALLCLIFFLSEKMRLGKTKTSFHYLGNLLTPKGQRPFFGLFLEFGQPIADAIFVQKISNFW
jgi:hypothetical protein